MLISYDPSSGLSLNNRQRTSIGTKFKVQVLLGRRNRDLSADVTDFGIAQEAKDWLDEVGASVCFTVSVWEQFSDAAGMGKEPSVEL
jgi:hypothetical protein